jgi:hypothetical protein
MLGQLIFIAQLILIFLRPLDLSITDEFIVFLAIIVIISF